MSMRKGTSFVEMLAVIFVIGVLLLPFAQLTTTTFRDVPYSYRSSNVNTTLLNAIRQIRRDINKAVGFPDFYNSLANDDRTLLIQLPDRLICYGFDSDKIIRYVLVNPREEIRQERMEWSVPRGVINWKLLQNGDKTYAVELHKYVEHRTGGVIERKFANSYVFFVGAYPEPIQ
jgi:hypothetical protein